MAWYDKIYTQYAPEKKKQLNETYLSNFRKAYDITDDQAQIIAPLLAAGVDESEILQYLSNLRSKDISDRDNSIFEQVQQQRAAGLNPDLTGVGSLSGSVDGSAPQFEPLPSSGGKGTLSQRAQNIVSQVLSVATFGLQAYGVISSGMMREGLQLAGFAADDVKNVLSDDSGRVVDVGSALSDLVRSRGLTGRKARLYAGEVSRRINSYGTVLERLNTKVGLNRARKDFRISSYEASDEYIDQATTALDLAQKLTIKTHEKDLLEAEQISKFLQDHPEYNEESLMAELSAKKSSATEAATRADQAQVDLSTSRLQNAGQVTQNKISEENLEQEKIKTQSDRSAADVVDLRNNLTKVELDGIDDMLKYVRWFEQEKYDFDNRLGKYSSYSYYGRASSRNDPYRIWENSNHSGFYESKKRYDAYKKQISKYYKGKDGKFRVSAGYGPVRVGVSK